MSATFDAKTLGSLIRRIRLARGLTLKQIESTAGVSATHVSEIERGRTSPTVGALERIAEALSVDVATLIERRADPPLDVSTAGERIELVLASGGIVLRPLTSGRPAREISLLEVRVEADRLANPRPHRAGGEEIFVVLEGSIEVATGTEHFDLDAGDTLHVRAKSGVRVRRRGQTPARVLWATHPPYVL